MRDGWVETTLDGIADVIMGQSPDGKSYNQEGKGLPFMQGSAEFGEHNPVPQKWCSDPKKIAEPGDLLLSVRAPVGDTNFADQRIAVGRGLSIIRANKESLTEFIRLVIQLNVAELIASSGSGMFASITGKNLKEFKVNLPTLPEQKRIVDLISSVDSYIEALQQQLESAKKSRNAVLHELLTASGDDWIKSNLGSIAKWSGGITPSMANSEFWIEGDIPWISSGDIATYESQGTKKNVTRKALSDSSLKLLPIGTVILVVRSGILIHSLPVAILRVPACINQDIKAAQVNENVEPEFLWIYLRFMEKEILSKCRKTGTTVQSISTEALLSMTINVPPLATQNSIVNMILMIDDMVNKTAQTINEAKNLRSGLLSELLSGEHDIPASYDKVLGAT
jgi:type I restriction enzyme S subunit